jgi:hypothetical protein
MSFFEGLTTWFEPERPIINIYHTWLCRYGYVLRKKTLIGMSVVHSGLGTSYKVRGQGSNLYFITINVTFEGLMTWFEPKRPSVHMYHTLLCSYGCVLEYKTTYVSFIGV